MQRIAVFKKDKDPKYIEIKESVKATYILYLYIWDVITVKTAKKNRQKIATGRKMMTIVKKTALESFKNFLKML